MDAVVFNAGDIRGARGYLEHWLRDNPDGAVSHMKLEAVKADGTIIKCLFVDDANDVFRYAGHQFKHILYRNKRPLAADVINYLTVLRRG